MIRLHSGVMIPIFYCYLSVSRSRSRSLLALTSFYLLSNHPIIQPSTPVQSSPALLQHHGFFCSTDRYDLWMHWATELRA